MEKYFRQIFKDYHSWSYCEKTLFLKLQMRALKLLYCLRGTCFTRSGNWFSLWHTTTSSRDVHDKVIRLNKYFTVVWASTLEFSVKRGTAKYCNSHWYSKYFRVISQTLLIDVLVKGKNSAVMFLNGQPPRCSSKGAAPKQKCFRPAKIVYYYYIAAQYTTFWVQPQKS